MWLGLKGSPSRVMSVLESMCILILSPVKAVLLLLLLLLLLLDPLLLFTNLVRATSMQHINPGYRVTEHSGGNARA